MSTETVKIPDLGSPTAVSVIEIHVAVGDAIANDQTIVVLEGDKATMDIPSSTAGTVTALYVKVGDLVKTGDAVLEVSVSAKTDVAVSVQKKNNPSETSKASAVQPVAPTRAPVEVVSSADVYAGPKARRVAHLLGISLSQVSGTGKSGRVTAEDVLLFANRQLQGIGLSSSGLGASSSGPGASSSRGLTAGSIPYFPDIDFSAFGEVQLKPLSKINKLSAQFLTRNWQHIPHVTQCDEADVTELEVLRKKLRDEAKAGEPKVTMLSFLMKACAAALQKFTTFNASLSHDGQSLILKSYVNIGVAVDTPHGLVVPVVRDVPNKSLKELAHDLATLSEKARDGKLLPGDMQGSCFSISSLGGIGGTFFTPIINWPDVAILGVSKMQAKPVWSEVSQSFEKRWMLPLSLSYDHRVIDGAEAARFITYLSGLLAAWK